MRILQVIHQFPPYAQQGSEVYCAGLSKQLSATDDVRVFHMATDGRPRKARLLRESHDGLSVYHFVDRGQYSRIADWPNVDLQESFRTVVAHFAPDVIHFHNFLSLGDDLVTLARASGAAVVYTLHDFGLICPNTLLLRSDGALCHKRDGDFFQDCCPTLIRSHGRPRASAPWSAQLPSLARWQLYGQQYSQPAIRTLLLAAIRALALVLGAPAVTNVDRKRVFFLEHTRRIFRSVDLFLAPSVFLRERYVNCGISPGRIVHLPNGMRRQGPVGKRTSSQQIRFGYIGALHTHKGIELLLDAFRGLGGRASLELFGSAFGSPVSESYARRLARGGEPNVFFRGPYDNRDVHKILASVDVIIVPSLWYENSPLTIQEAFLSGVPVITGNVGGMAEMVRDGVNGLHFRVGDAADLNAKLRFVVEHPELLDNLREGIPAVPTIEEHSAEVRRHYRQLLENSRRGRSERIGES